MTTPVTPHLADAAGRTDLEDWGALDEATAEPMQTAGLQLSGGRVRGRLGGDLGVHGRSVSLAARDP